MWLKDLLNRLSTDRRWKHTLGTETRGKYFGRCSTMREVLEFFNKNLYEQGHPFHPYCLFESILSWVHFLPLNQVFYRHNICASWVVEQQGREGRNRGVKVSIFFLFWPTLSSSERAIGVGSPRHFVQGFLLGSPSKIPAVHPAMTRAVTSPMFCKHRGSIPGLPQMASTTPHFGLLVGLFGHVGCPIRDPSVCWQVLHHPSHTPGLPVYFHGKNRGRHQGHLNSNRPHGSSLEYCPLKFRESRDSGRHEKIISRKKWRKTRCLLTLPETLP